MYCGVFSAGPGGVELPKPSKPPLFTPSPSIPPHAVPSAQSTIRSPQSTSNRKRPRPRPRPLPVLYCMYTWYVLRMYVYTYIHTIHTVHTPAVRTRYMVPSIVCRLAARSSNKPRKSSNSAARYSPIFSLARPLVAASVCTRRRTLLLLSRYCIQHRVILCTGLRPCAAAAPSFADIIIVLG